MTERVLDGPFLGGASAAFVEKWRRAGRFPIDSEATRRPAHRSYEEALVRKGGVPRHRSA